MSYRGRLKECMLHKEDLIQKKIDKTLGHNRCLTTLYKQVDYDNIDLIRDEEAKRLYTRLQAVLGEISYINYADGMICIQCLQNLRCETCTYSGKAPDCDSKGSTYRKIRKCIGINFTGLYVEKKI